MPQKSLLRVGLLGVLTLGLAACGDSIWRDSYYTVIPTTDNTIRFKARDLNEEVNIKDQMAMKASEHCAIYDRIARLSTSEHDGTYVWQTYVCLDNTES